MPGPDLKGNLINKGQEELQKHLKDVRADQVTGLDKKSHAGAGAAEHKTTEDKSDQFLGAAPDRSLKDLQNLFKETSPDSRKLEQAMTKVLQSPGGREQILDLMVERYSQPGRAQEDIAVQLRDAAKNVGMSESEFQKLTSEIAYAATRAYISEAMSRGGNEINTAPIKQIQGSLTFNRNTLRNAEEVEHAIKSAVKEGVHEIVNNPDRGGFENRSAHALVRAFRLGDEALKPDARVQQENQVVNIVLGARQPNETVDDKVARLRDLQAQMGIRDGEMHKLIEREMKEYLKDPANRQRLADMNPEQAKALHADLQGVKDAFYYRLEKVYTNIGEAQNILEDNIERNKRLAPPATAAAAAAQTGPVVVPAAPSQSPTISASAAGQTGPIVVPAAQPTTPQPAAAQQQASPAQQPVDPVAENEKLKQQIAEMQAKLEAQQKAEEAKIAAQKEAELKASIAAAKQEVGALLNGSPHNGEIAAHLREIENRHGFTEDQMRKEVIEPLLRENGTAFVAGLNLAQSREVKQSFDIVAQRYDLGAKSVRELDDALSNHISRLEKAMDADVERRAEALNASWGYVNDDELGALKALQGLNKEELGKLRDVYRRKFGVGLDEKIQSKLGGDDLVAAQAQLAGDPAAGKAALIKWARDNNEAVFLAELLQESPGAQNTKEPVAGAQSEAPRVRLARFSPRE